MCKIAVLQLFKLKSQWWVDFDLDTYKFVAEFVCNRGDTILCHGGLHTTKYIKVKRMGAGKIKFEKDLANFCK